MINTTDYDPYQLLDQLASELKQTIEQQALEDPLMIGIHTGGLWIAEYLHSRIGITEPLGVLDISFYRDDFSRIGVNPEVKPSSLPFDVEGRNLLLIDDVFYTGRTIRAALNEIFDYGRPACVILGVLLERNGRQIPLQPDCRGTKIELPPHQRIKLTGPDPLQLVVQTVNRDSS